MNNYQAQQFWNDISGVIGFTTSIIVLGFMVGMVKPMGRFFEPPLRPEKHPPKPIVKEVTVPGGSYWVCVSCGKGLPSGIKVFKAGKEVYCSIPCIKLPEHHSSGGEIMEIERYHGIIVAVGGINTKSPGLPDWDISYVEYPPGQMKEFRGVLMKAHVSIVRVTDRRIYFEQ